MLYLTGSLGPTASQARREYAYLDYGNDGRKGTIFLNVWHAHRRHNTAVFTSTYSVGEVDAVGFAGRVFVLDKLTGEDEHPRREGDRKPPYQVRCREYVGDDGEVTCVVTCGCMASGCNAPCCRHKDLIQELLAQGAFDETQTEYDNWHGAQAYQRTEQKADRPARVPETHANRNGEQAGGEATHLPELRGWADDPRASANPHFANQTIPLLSNAECPF